MSKHTNALANASSPYLLQHAHNPVNWVEWSEAAFQKAEEENKLILVSIGYSTCHWCHVMERECFENEDVAQLMNAHFVCIKVDREERPDVDQVYMLAVQMMTQRGGWPLNCFCLPDGNPIYGGTYFPKEQWMHILSSLHDGYLNEKEKFIEYAIKLHFGMKQVDVIPKITSSINFSTKKLQVLVENWKATFDNKNGGNNRAPKFPMPNNFLFLLRYAIATNDNMLKEYVKLTLQKMARGGIYDQIGGGFARYSTDMLWKVPHFEKMLYDNAQLISLYAMAYQTFQLEEFKTVVEETLDWLEREMKNSFGSFYTAIDADSEGKEGLFYTWSAEALKTILGNDFDWFSKYYNVNENGYWHEEQAYILLRNESVDEFAKNNKLKTNEFKTQLKTAQQKLLEIRNKRIKPGLDDKSLCSWNALLITGFCDVYKTFGCEKCLTQALQIAQWIEQYQHDKKGELLRTFKSGKARINGFLEDYATVIEAWLNLYSVTFDEKWIFKAQQLAEYTVKHFGDKKSGLFYFTKKNTELITRKIELNDNVIPAANSIMAKNFFKLGKLLGQNDYIQKSKEMLHYVYENMHEFGTSYSNWADLLMNFTQKHYEIVIIGDDYKTYVSALRKHYTPNITMIASLSENQLKLTKNRAKQGETLIYVCQDQSCLQPTTDIKKVLELVLKTQ